MKPWHALLLLSLILTSLAPSPSMAQVPASAGSVAELHRLVETALAEEPPVTRGALVVVGRGGVLTQHTLGRTREDTRLPLLDISAWLTTVAVLTLVERDQVALDDPLSKWLPEVPAGKGAITLRQLLAHTSGLAAQHACLGDRQTTLAQCAAAILAEPSRAAPGREIFFGNAPLQVAGWLAETVSGRGWAEFFQERVADPLGLACVTYGATANPDLARGARGCPGDVAAFLRFLVQDPADGSSPLSPATHAAMFRPQTAAARAVYVPDAATGFGLGPALSAPWVHTPGTFGPPLWVDREAGLGMALLVIAAPERSAEIAAELRAILLTGV